MSELFIGGSWRDAANGGRADVINPFDQRLISTVSDGDAEDTQAAISAARTAFDDGPWPRTPPAERAQLLLRVADLLERDKEEIAATETLDTGKPLVESRIDVDDVASVFRYYARLGAELKSRTVDAGSTEVSSRVDHEPVGVCGLITPWNYPLLQASWKIAPALVAGNTMVVKPSEITPLTTIMLFRLLAEAGLPAGVANLVLGTGPSVGAPLAEDPAVDLVSFTGSLRTGQWIMRAAADTVKKVCLELGGKNPNIVFADADLDAALDYALTAVFLHAGQVCSAGTRLLVQDSVYTEFVTELARKAERIRLGNGFDPDSESGPLVSAQHLAKVTRYGLLGVQEGARLLTGGHRPTQDGLADGFFYRPTVFADCTREMTVVREETFGPIVTAERFDTEDEAIALGNDTEYGLAGAVWTQDIDRGERVAARLRHGTVWINDFGPYLPAAEWGGFKRSGVGRELGPSGLHEYCEAKHVYRNHKPVAQHYFARTPVE
ncbi:MAG TPA: aldehyde dehydrogenase family protein [Pseudonocardiaceae bacterium]|jgi:betaine-aldehyde dehydrogenase|nr:aldehyde dehydrogenase family protein [Pseudonocardiaceae bacterium]